MEFYKMATVAEVKARARAKARAKARKKREAKQAIIEGFLFMVGIFLAIFAVCFLLTIPEMLANIIIGLL